VKADNDLRHRPNPIALLSRDARKGEKIHGHHHEPGVGIGMKVRRYERLGHVPSLCIQTKGIAESTKEMGWISGIALALRLPSISDAENPRHQVMGIMKERERYTDVPPSAFGTRMKKMAIASHRHIVRPIGMRPNPWQRKPLSADKRGGVIMKRVLDRHAVRRPGCAWCGSLVPRTTTSTRLQPHVRTRISILAIC
jgi:hypothetical protein